MSVQRLVPLEFAGACVASLMTVAAESTCAAMAIVAAATNARDHVRKPDPVTVPDMTRPPLVLRGYLMNMVST